MLKFFQRISLAQVLLLFLACPSPALETGAGLDDSSPVSLTADELSYDRESETYLAAGRVRLQRGELTLLSDAVRFDAATGEALATGDIRLTDPDGLAFGESLGINVNSGEGRLQQGRIFIRERNFRLAGEVIEKLGEQTYRVTGGTFTTCDGEVPDWKFSARRLDVILGQYATARHVIFYLHDIPVFYSPYLVYPVKTERESGFLMPRLGYSEKRGAQVSLAYYQVLARNQDATFFLDYLGNLGLGTGAEYRYIFGESERENEGVLRGYHVTGFAEEEDRTAFDWKHSGRLPAGVRLIADVEYASDREYFEDFGEFAEEYNKEVTESVISVSRNWSRYSLAGQMRHTRDLLVENNDLTLQRLPELIFTAAPQRIGEQSPFFFHLDSSYTHFWRREGETGQRLQARPAISAVFQPGQVLEIIPEVGYRQRVYWTSEEDEQDGLYDFSTRIFTRFSRVFQTPGRRTVKKVQHVIEPEALYTYIPNQNQAHLPQFDALDFIGPINRIGYAITNRLTAKIDGETGSIYRELAYLRLSQDYDIREGRRDPLSADDERRPFSDIRAELRLLPTDWSYAHLEAHYDVYGDAADSPTERFRVFNTLAGIHDRAGSGISANYRYQRDELAYLSANLDIAWLNPVFVNYQHRHDLREARALEKLLNVEYRSQCWSLFLTLRDRLEDREILLGFALTGLGRVARLGGSLGGEQENN